MEIDTDFSHLEFVLAWFFIYFPWGRNGVKGAANGIAWVIESAHKGTGFAFASFTTESRWIWLLARYFLSY